MTRILVVEDEPIQCANLQFALAQEGYRVQTAADPDEAIAITEWFCPHLLVVDWMLRSECDGRMLMRRLQEQNPNLRTIIITGYPLYELEEMFDDWDDFEIMEKPFSLTTLLHSVRAHAREIDRALECQRTASLDGPVGCFEAQRKLEWVPAS